MKKTYSIDVDCANCAGKMEAAAQKIPGIREASIHFFAQKMMVEFEEGADDKAVMQAVAKACKKFGIIEL